MPETRSTTNTPMHCGNGPRIIFNCRKNLSTHMKRSGPSGEPRRRKSRTPKVRHQHSHSNWPGMGSESRGGPTIVSGLRFAPPSYVLLAVRRLKQETRRMNGWVRRCEAAAGTYDDASLGKLAHRFFTISEKAGDHERRHGCHFCGCCCASALALRILSTAATSAFFKLSSCTLSTSSNSGCGASGLSMFSD